MEFREPLEERPGTSHSPALYSEVEELNHILRVERELVVKTQENYKALKTKFLEIKEENDLMDRELQLLRTEIVDGEKVREHLGNLEQKHQRILKRMEEDNKMREVKYERFRADTLTELQRVFRKELADQETTLSILNKEKDELIEENDRLIEESRNVKSDLAKEKRTHRRRENELKMDFNKQIEELLRTIDEQSEKPADTKISDKLEGKIQELQEKLRIKEEEWKARETELEKKLEANARELEEQKSQATRAKAISQSSVEEISLLKQHLHRKGKELEDTRSKLHDCMKERVSVEMQNAARERRLATSYEEQSSAYEQNLTVMETSIRERDRIIEDLQEQLNDTHLVESSFRSMERNAVDDKEERQQLELKIKMQQIELDKKDNEYACKVSELKLDRNRLETYVAELKKRLQTSPETVAEVSRLRDELHKRKEEISQMKNHYRSLLSRMKASLLNLEKKHRKAQKKLDESIFI